MYYDGVGLLGAGGVADWTQNQEKIAAIHRKLMDKEDAYTGWVAACRGGWD